MRITSERFMLRIYGGVLSRGNGSTCIVNLCFVFLWSLGLMAVSCGGSDHGTRSDHGPDAVVNASSLESATSHWSSAECGIELELGANGEIWSIVMDTSGGTSSGGGHWTADDSNGLL